MAICFAGQPETHGSGTLVRLESNLGTFEMELFDTNAPATVANFLSYIDDGKFDRSIVHRSVRNFVVQSGGFTLSSNSLAPVATKAAVTNEPGISNLRGTVAMAKMDDDPNSATSQWFVNLGNNASDLDAQNGGFTVFGRVAGLGMAVVESMASVPVYDVRTNLNNAALRELPLLAPQLQVQNLLIFDRVARLPTGSLVHFYDFAQSDHGFTAGFSDLPADYDPALYELASGHQARPTNLGGAKALFISGANRSDDLFMFWKKKVTGLAPNTEYEVAIDLELASSYAEGLAGIGGPPGEAVTVKLGASVNEPVVAPDSNGHLAVSIDKGNQSQGGKDVAAIGNVAKPDDGSEDYAILYRSNRAVRQIARTSSDGSLWLIAGTDSGYEGKTSLYFTGVSAVFVPKSSSTPKSQSVRLRIPPKVYFGGSYSLTGSATSRLPVVYTVGGDPSAANVVGNTLRILRAASFTLTVSQSGNETWLPATNTIKVTPLKRPQRIAFTTKGVRKVEETFALSVTVNSELDVTVTSSNPEIMRINGNGTATALKPGKVELTAAQLGDDNHLPAKPVRRKVSVK